MKDTMKTKLEFSIEYYNKLAEKEGNPISYMGFLYGQAQAYENILKWIIQEEIKVKEM